MSAEPLPTRAAPLLRSAAGSSRVRRYHSLVAGATLVFVSTFAWQLAGFVFNSVGAHTLGPSNYGVLAATVGLLALLAPAMMAMQSIASREVTSIRGRDLPGELASTVWHYGLRVCLGAGVLGLVLAAFAGPISSLFHLGSPWGVRIAAICVAIYLPSHFLSGLLQGGERFGPFAFETTLEATAKIVFAAVLIGLLWRTPLAGMVAIAASAALGLGVNVVLVRQYIPRREPGTVPTRVSPGYSFTALATFGLLALLLAADTLIGKHYLPGQLAGLYAGVSLTGKIVFFATTALSIVVFPIFSRHQDAGIHSPRSLGAAMATALSIIAVTLFVLAVVPRLVVSALLGQRYLSITGFVVWMGASFGIYAIAYLLATYLLARRQRSVIVALAMAVVVQFAGFYAFHSSIHDMIAVEGFAFTTAIAGCVLILLASHVLSARDADGEPRRSNPRPSSVVSSTEA
jgi:O-antigen/teichoic acid export membrane protein